MRGTQYKCVVSALTGNTEHGHIITGNSKSVMEIDILKYTLECKYFYARNNPTTKLHSMARIL